MFVVKYINLDGRVWSVRVIAKTKTEAITTVATTLPWCRGILFVRRCEEI